jgi:type II secretory pathway pseudopilin PulG
MQSGSRRGFTILEALVAIVVLGVGVLALGATAALSARLIGQGRRATLAATLALSRIEDLRRAAGWTPGCAALSAGSAVHSGQVTESWAPSGSGMVRTVRVVVSYPSPAGMRSDSTVTRIRCL